MGNTGCIFIVFLYLFNKIHARMHQSGQDEMVQEPYKILLRDNYHLIVDLDIGEDDYEMIGKSVRIREEDKIFQEFNMIAIKEYERFMEMNRVDARLTHEKALNMIMKEIGNRTLLKVNSQQLNQTRKINATNEKVEYYYLVSEYYADAMNDTTTAKCYNPVEVTPSDTGLLDTLKLITSLNNSHKCTEQELKGIGIEAIKCLLAKFYTKQQDIKTLAKNLWKVAAIWLAVYFIIAVPLWCTRGGCSCCLCCKFFKPQQTIQEAKNYLLLNPPGILVTKRGGIIQYEPTEREKDCYEEFGHFLRTL